MIILLYEPLAKLITFDSLVFAFGYAVTERIYTTT